MRVAFSGYFDPLHVGHLEGLKLAKKLCISGKLIVIVNSDHQCRFKKGYSFMPEKERMEIMKSLRYVDEVVLSVDQDGTQCETLKLIQPDLFAKGGDRKADEIPEAKVCKELGIGIVDGLGKKIQSSSELVSKSKKHKF